MKRVFSTIAILVFLAIAGAACVEDAAPIFPDNNVTNGGNENGGEGDDDNKDDGNGDEGGNEQPPMYNDYPDAAWREGYRVRWRVGRCCSLNEILCWRKG